MKDLTDVPLSRQAKDQFQQLVEANLDSYHVLTEIADRMNDPVFAEDLREIAVRRGKNAEELETHLRQNEESPPTQGTLCGKLRQAWVDVRAAINAGDTYVMLVEAEKAERAIESAYTTAIKHLSNSALLSAVLDHVHVMNEDSNTISEFRKNMKRVRRGFAPPDAHP